MNLSDVKAGLINASASINRRLKEMKEQEKDRTSLLLNKIVELAPLIDLTGFNMKELIVQAGIPAGATIVFVREKEVDAATVEALLQKNEKKELLVLIVRALQKAENLQKKMKLSGYNFTAMHLKLGVPPEVSLSFLRANGTGDFLEMQK